ncbi:MAG: hypothetical protein JWQ74_442 [Marmoricola sp.]|nr:hypothetical protein [Marmoricola sp.]
MVAAPKTLAQANRKLVWVPAGGIVSILAPKVTELVAAGVVDLSCLVTKADYTLGPTGDAQINDPALCAVGESTVPGNTTFEASMVFFRSVDTAATPDPLSDKAWNLFTSKGINGFLVERIGMANSYLTAFAVGDKVRVFGVITGSPMMRPYPTDGGFEKFTQPFNVQSEQVNERAVMVA